ncbi:outer membrane protein [Nitratireductor pacificus]|uniref:Porin, opacity type n=1 Tax=Nitratireductor pacificus pht-3B TaxID=391937 RepID=K2ME92_9HYPH|nr:outer membrane protein [Nitratireductor pacificus]EKF19075.1 porin, opacity type [Nitratireductor pacificus pht-3B]
MSKFSKVLGAALLFIVPTVGFAADLYEPPIIEAPPPQIIEPAPSFGGWYIRGDIDYHWSKLRGTEYITYGAGGGTDRFDTTKLKGAMSLGAGVGYQISRHLRTDLTADYWFKSDFDGTTSGTCGGGGACVSTDKSAYSALLLMANAYVDLGTYYRVTPYVGAGIGGAYVKWDDLTNSISGGGTVVHKGSSNWRFAYSLMAGASYCLTQNLNLDVGYRYTRLAGGRMFEYASGVAPGFDKGINVHEARAGLRYQFGPGNANCAPAPQVVSYEPPPFEPPVYK